MTMRHIDAGLNATRGLLLASGLLAAGVAATTLIAPRAFHAFYGIEIGTEVNLSNELKAPAGVLLVTGLLALAAVFRIGLANLALGTGAGVFLSYGISRLFSMATDGAPDSALVLAAVIELATGAACLIRLGQIRRAATSSTVHHQER